MLSISTKAIFYARSLKGSSHQRMINIMIKFVFFYLKENNAVQTKTIPISQRNDRIFIK